MKAAAAIPRLKDFDDKSFDVLVANRSMSGHTLARLEMTRALNAILDRLPDVRLDPGHAPPHPIGYDMRVPDHIHVTFGIA